MLAYRSGSATTALTRVSGPADLEVTAELALRTYTVAVNGVVAQAGIPFDNAVALNTVRFFTDGLNETSFAGRRFDDVEISWTAN